MQLYQNSSIRHSNCKHPSNITDSFLQMFFFLILNKGYKCFFTGHRVNKSPAL